jgi:hypothetical protein
MDPLRPFSDLIRALWRSSGTRVGRTHAQGEARPATPEHVSQDVSGAESADLPLRSEIRTRIRQIGLGDPQRVREAFVEIVITRELGLSATHAADFAELAQQVAARIGSHKEVSERLHVLLTELAKEPAAG